VKIITFLLEWYQQNKRDFPWRNTKDFYKIWVCEVIFQQTRIQQGMEYYNRFLLKFPTLESLARANEQEVLAQWQGLGYYSRARNLHFSAKYIFYDLKNEYPTEFKEILKLKGVGNYTAAAISSICFDEKIPAIDGNALRVYARIFNDFSDISLSTTSKKYFEQVKPYLKNIPAGNYNQAIMELGALVCIPRNPKCVECPVTNYCKAFKDNTQKDLPVKISKLKVNNEKLHYFFITDGAYFLIQKRIENSIWKNMYEFMTSDFDFTNVLSEKIIQHKLTHKNLEISIKEILVDSEDLKSLLKKENLLCVTISDAEKFPFPIIFKKYFLEYFK